jgi:hypothetical protein
MAADRQPHPLRACTALPARRAVLVRACLRRRHRPCGPGANWPPPSRTAMPSSPSGCGARACASTAAAFRWAGRQRGKQRRGQLQEGGALAAAGRRAGPGRGLVRAVAHLCEAGVFPALWPRPRNTSSAPPKWVIAMPSWNAATPPGARAARTRAMTCAPCSGCRRRRRRAARRRRRCCARSRRARRNLAGPGRAAGRDLSDYPLLAARLELALAVRPEPRRSAAAGCEACRPRPLPGGRHPRQLRAQPAPPGAGGNGAGAPAARPHRAPVRERRQRPGGPEGNYRQRLYRLRTCCPRRAGIRPRRGGLAPDLAAAPYLDSDHA